MSQIDACRSAFTEWAKPKFRSMSRNRNGDGYMNGDTALSWRAWKAAWSARKSLPLELVRQHLIESRPDTEWAEFIAGVIWAERQHGIGEHGIKEKS
jgi:hypothetical protein